VNTLSNAIKGKEVKVPFFNFLSRPAGQRATAALTCFLAGIVGASASVPLVPINQPILPSLSGAKVTGAPPSSTVIPFEISLAPRSPAALQAFCDSVSNPASPNYRKFITPGQVGSQFGATSANVLAVVNYLRSKGMTITLSASNGMGVMAKGTVSQIQTAFSTTIKNYSGKDPLGNAITFRANSTPFKMPSNLAPLAVAITGVDTYIRPHKFATQTLTPIQARTLYNSQPAFVTGIKGQGRTIAVSNFDGFRTSNIPTFLSTFGLPAPAAGAGTNVIIVPVGAQTGTGPEGGEGDLDFEFELGQAPLATILIYDGSDLIEVLTKEAQDNFADTLSESYGWILPAASAMAAHNQHLAMTAQGQTYMHATGDTGTNFQNFNYPDEEPETLAVGGSVATVDNSGNRLDEVGWPGSGGGWSTDALPFNTLPSWQTGTGVPTNINFRLVPDLALHADGNGGGYFFIFAGTEQGVSGTSCSSPVCAANFALLEQRLLAAGQPTGRLGRIQDLLYAQNGDPSIWNDLTVGTNGNLPNGQISNCTAGWDFVTGWGAPNFDGLFNALVNAGVPATIVPPDPGAFTYTGEFDDGDSSSLATVDGVTFDIDTDFFPQFGQAAGIQATFTLPSAPTTISIDIQAQAGAAGATNMIWAYDWTVDSTGANPAGWTLVGSSSLPAQADSPSSISIKTNIANFVSSTGQVMLRSRGHIPVRPIVGPFPSPFTYSIDLLQLEIR
jgi:subtilase family serine protease